MGFQKALPLQHFLKLSVIRVAEAFSPGVMALESHERHLVNSLLQLPVRDLQFAILFGSKSLVLISFTFNLRRVSMLTPVLTVTASWVE